MAAAAAPAANPGGAARHRQPAGAGPDRHAAAVGLGPGHAADADVSGGVVYGGVGADGDGPVDDYAGHRSDVLRAGGVDGC